MHKYEVRVSSPGKVLYCAGNLKRTLPPTYTYIYIPTSNPEQKLYLHDLIYIFPLSPFLLWESIFYYSSGWYFFCFFFLSFCLSPHARKPPTLLYIMMLAFVKFTQGRS